jgi:hypothetical protein
VPYFVQLTGSVSDWVAGAVGLSLRDAKISEALTFHLPPVQPVLETT